MPELDGVQATARIVESCPDTRVLVLTTFDLDEVVYGSLRAGASGFLLKDAPEERLITAIRVVAEGGSLFAPSVTRRLVEEFARRAPAPVPGSLRLLTAKETEVLTLVARGFTNAEIARTIFITENTVKTHVARILMKLNLRDRVQACCARIRVRSGRVVALTSVRDDLRGRGGASGVRRPRRPRRRRTRRRCRRR